MQPQKSASAKKEKHHTSYEVQCFLVENTGPILITVTLLQSMHGALLGELSPHSFGNNKKHHTFPCGVFFLLVENTGPILITVTSCSPCTALSWVS